MSEFAIAIDYQRRPSSKFTAHGRQPFNHLAGFGRMEALDAGRNGARAGALTSPPRHLDAKLVEDGEALEAAWADEITTLIAKKRLRTPEAEAAASAARSACALIVARIERANALTLDGLKVKARAILWTRNGEPLGVKGVEETCQDE
jgi:hypothetical protein